MIWCLSETTTAKTKTQVKKNPITRVFLLKFPWSCLWEKNLTGACCPLLKLGNDLFRIDTCSFTDGGFRPC